MKLFWGLFLMTLIISPVKLNAQSQSMHAWAETKTNIRKFCFYPTTLRMININHDSSFYTLVKDIHKLQIFMIDNKKLLKEGELLSIKQGIRKEEYKDMIQFHQGQSSISVFVKERENKPVGFTGIIDAAEGLILFDLEGNLSPDVIRMLIAGKFNSGSMSKIMNIMQIGKESKAPNKK